MKNNFSFDLLHFPLVARKRLSVGFKLNNATKDSKITICLLKAVSHGHQLMQNLTKSKESDI